MNDTPTFITRTELTEDDKAELRLLRTEVRRFIGQPVTDAKRQWFARVNALTKRYDFNSISAYINVLSKQEDAP